ncbi:MAG: amidase, partial [Candidatus Binatia bacterium]
MTAASREPWELTLLEAASSIRDRRLSAVELTRVMLDRIDQLDRELRSYVTVSADLALRQAAAADHELRNGHVRGPLHGVPVALKDLIDTKDVRTTYGSKIFAGSTPTEDAAVTERLSAAGAVLLGKLKTTEFACTGYHPSVAPPLNPWNPGHWPGASSSGSGVATAARLSFGALGTDTGGSVRFPSSACGVVGLKPTAGTVSLRGVFPLAPSLDHVGPFARTVADVAAIFGVIAGFDPRDPRSRRGAVPECSASLDGTARGLRIGIDERLCTSRVEAEVAASVLRAARVLAEMGGELRDVAVPSLEDGVNAWSVIFAAECAATHEETYAKHGEDYGPGIRQFLESGLQVRGVDYARAWETRLALRRAF